MHKITQTLFTDAQIQQRVRELAAQLAADCRGPNLVVVGVLRGSFMFMADMVRAMDGLNIHPRIDFMALESYGAGTVSSGTVKITKDVGVDLRNADVLLVDDILDSGRTLSFACEHLRKQGARSVKTCVLLDKPARRAVPFQADYAGFTIPDHFVVGYGLDHDSRYRELPYIGIVAE